MGLVTFAQEIESPISPRRLFRALILDSHNLLPSLIPTVIKSFLIIHGNGDVGSIKQINFVPGSCFVDSLKFRIDKLNEEKCEYTYTIIEAEGLGEKLEYATFKLKYEAKKKGGCVRRVLSEYYTVQDFKLTEEQIEFGKEKTVGWCKTVEDYLLANPNAYV